MFYQSLAHQIIGLNTEATGYFDPTTTQKIMSFFQSKQAYIPLSLQSDMGLHLATSGILCKELWPNGMGIIEIEDYMLESGDSFTITQPWQVVPSSFEGVCEWAFVTADHQSPDWTRSYLILYRQPEDTDDLTVVYPVTLRLQGKIKAFNLATFGNWNGCVIKQHKFRTDSSFLILSMPHTATMARQFIALESGGVDEPWACMQKGLRDIRQMIHNTLSRGTARREEIMPESHEDIYLSRRVFQKVSLISCTAPLHC